MAFSSNAERYSFPHRRVAVYEPFRGYSFGPSNITRGHEDGDILVSTGGKGARFSRRLRPKIRTFTFEYENLEYFESMSLWDFYDDKAEHELYHFYINLYYMSTDFDNEWIAVNFSQKMSQELFLRLISSPGIQLTENLVYTYAPLNPVS